MVAILQMLRHDRAASHHVDLLVGIVGLTSTVPSLYQQTQNVNFLRDTADAPCRGDQFAKGLDCSMDSSSGDNILTRFGGMCVPWP